MTEREFTALLIGTQTNPGLARILGWKPYHTLRSKGSQPGYPDWTLARDRLVFLELKTEVGKVSDAQRDWLTWLRDAGGEAYVVRPHQLDDLSVVLGWHRTMPITPGYASAWSRLDFGTPYWTA